MLFRFIRISALRVRHRRFLEQYAEQLFQQLLQRHHGEQQRHNRNECRGRKSDDGISRYGRGAHGPHHLVTVAQIGKRLDVGAAEGVAFAAVVRTLSTASVSRVS